MPAPAGIAYNFNEWYFSGADAEVSNRGLRRGRTCSPISHAGHCRLIPLLIGISFVSFVVMQLRTGISRRAHDGLESEGESRGARAAGRSTRAGSADSRPVLCVGSSDMAMGDFGDVVRRRPAACSWTRSREAFPSRCCSTLCLWLDSDDRRYPIGVYSAVHRVLVLDRITTVLVFLGFAMPTFWLALLCMMLFGVRFGLAADFGTAVARPRSASAFGHGLVDRARHLVLPVVISSVTQAWPASPATCARACSR